MVEYIIQIKSRITINEYKNLKKIMCAKNIIFGILLDVVVKMVNIWHVLLTISLHGMKLQTKQKHINKCIVNIESNDKLKETGIKNCTWNYFDEIIKIEDFDLDNILIDEESYENISVYNISNKTLISAKPLCILQHYQMSYRSKKRYYICYKVKVDSYDSLPLEKTLTLHNVITLIKSVSNKDKNYCYNIFLEKASYQLPRNNDTK